MQTHEYLEMHARILSRYNEAVERTCRQYDLNRTCFTILVFLKNNPRYDTARDIEEKRGIKKAIASVSIEKLCRSGYLARQPDPVDRRVRHLVLTEKASEIVAFGQQIQQSFFERLFSCLTDDEREAYSAIGQKMLNALRDMEAGNI